MVIVFDLDDTLYEELSFVRSGYRMVAQELVPMVQMSAEVIYQELMAEFQVGRTQVFDRYLDKMGIKTKRLVSNCLAVYRAHNPAIDLYPAAKRCLERFKNHPLYIVTDGNNRVQRRKFRALGLEGKIRKCLCTYSYGLCYSKPSPYCFERICAWEKVSPEQVIYVADNPYKDFVGIKPLGFRTIRVLTGPYHELSLAGEYEADLIIKDLNELSESALCRR